MSLFRWFGRSVFASLLLLALAGCVSHQVAIERVVPATTGFPVPVRKIGVIDRHVSSFRVSGDDGVGAALLNGLLFEVMFPKLGDKLDRLADKVNVKRYQAWEAEIQRELSANFEMDFLDIFKPLGYYEVTTLDWEEGDGVTEADVIEPGLLAPVDPERMSAFARTHDVDIVISIEAIRMHLREYAKEVTEKTKDKNGNETEKTTYNLNWEMSCSCVFRAFDRVSGVWIEQHVSTGDSSVHWSAQDSSSVTHNNDPYLVQTALAEALRSYAKSLTPHYERFDRPIYIGGDSAWRDAADTFLASRDAKAAIGKWEALLAQEDNPVKQGRLRYNIAVAYEFLGDYERAIEFAERSRPYGRSLGDYLSELQSHRSQTEEANFQLEEQEGEAD